jgi:formylglycine-generating enzyme required for sulfatase activity
MSVKTYATLPALMLGAALSLTGCQQPAGLSSNEKPAHAVQIDYAFSLGKYEVTFAEWDACVADAGCTYRPDDNGWGRGDRPVINVSYNDITGQFLPWLNRKFGLTGAKDAFRLPTEAEWEYAARAGTVTAWSCGDTEGCLASVAVYSAGKTQPVGSKTANPWGLYDMHGNAWEWTEDCYADSYAGAPNNGSALQGGNACYRVSRGGSWVSNPGILRSAVRDLNSPGFRYYVLGFRLARTLP